MILSTLFLAIVANGLVNFLVTMLIVAIVIYVVYLVINMIPIPNQNIKTIVYLILAVIIIIFLLNQFAGVTIF